jgi:hypothetical protein
MQNKIEVSDFNFYYGELSGAERPEHPDPCAADHRADWAFRLRQIDLSCAA